MPELVDHGYRSAVSGEDYGILNVACALSTAKYAITIPSRFKKLMIRSTDGATFKLFKASTGTAAFTVLANTAVELDLAGLAGTIAYVQFAAATKVLEVLYII